MTGEVRRAGLISVISPQAASPPGSARGRRMPTKVSNASGADGHLRVESGRSQQGAFTPSFRGPDADPFWLPLVIRTDPDRARPNLFSQLAHHFAVRCLDKKAAAE